MTQEPLLSRISGQPWGRWSLIGTPYVWLSLFILLPFLIVCKISVSELSDTGIGFLNMFSTQDGVVQLRLKFSNYVFLLSDSLYLKTYLSSLGYAIVTTVICLFLGYPFAYFLARAPITLRPVLMMLVMLPFWTSFLLRIYAWKGLLDTNGLINQLLLVMGVVSQPLHMMHTPFSLLVGMVYVYLPFMVLPLYANLVKMDLRLLEAATDLGAKPWTAFWRITVPLSRNGILAGAMLVFIPCVGEYVIPAMLGGPDTLNIGRVLWDEFFSNNDWAMASAVAVVMIVLILGPMAWFNRIQAAENAGGRL
ncbi:ABC transporter permease subunit [Limnohabitans sp.]|uniref:ABC transporter permease n=1 Tax=Limnohabitans sp. TaxID=1907725 RepID=UPI00286F8317|nr:ABC transporter permease subunit [Limnohabitans sp.]